MAFDDLCGEDGFGLDIGQDLPCRVGRRPVGRDHHLKRLGVVHDRTERLPELMPYRSSQRRDRLAAIGVGGESQVPPAFDLGALPCAALVQEQRDQERLEDQRANRGQNRELVFIPQARATIPHDAARRQPTLGDAPPLQLAPIEHRLTRQLWRYSEACRWLAIQDSTGHVGRAASKVVNGHHRPTDNSMSEHVGSALQTGGHSPWREGRRAPARPRTPRPARPCRR